MTMTMIQVILYLSVAIHLVHCWPIHSRSRRTDCSNIESAQQEKDRSGFRKILEDEIFTKKISDQTVRLNITVL